MCKSRYILLAACLALATALSADISVYLKNEQQNKKLATTTLDNREYVDIENLNPLLGSVTKLEHGDFRAHLYLFGEQFIFLPNSAYYSFKNEIHSMHYPSLASGEKFYLPANFILEQLPRHFPDNLSLKAKVLQVLRPKDKKVQRVILDPGHGGRDPGAVGKNGTREKDINLSVALKLKKFLEQELGLTVLMTRSDDRFVSLSDRTRFANDNRADVFISIHTNASQSRSARGLETYYLSTAMSSDARAVEALENDVVELYEGKGEKQKYDELAFILSDLSQTEHLENSNFLATFVHQNLVSGTKSCDRGIKQANFYVLRGTFMPSILIEMGFISNLDEEVLLKNGEYQERLARTVFEGVKRFKFRFDRSRTV